MKINTPQKICLAFFVLLIIFWVYLFVKGNSIEHSVDLYFPIATNGFFGSIINGAYLYSFLFGLIPLVGGLFAMIGSKTWGGLKSTVGRAVFFIGLGLLLWGCGETIWSYYNFFAGVAAPYPSWADLGFAPSIVFYGIGAIYLSVVTGAKFGLRKPRAKIFAILAPIVILAFSYYILVVIARGGVLIPEGETPLKTVLDLAYPLGDFVSLTLAVVISGLSFRYLGGMFKYDMVAILAGLAVMYIADSIFSYTTTAGTYFNADFGDLVLMIGLFLMTFGVLGFYKVKFSTETA